MKYFLYILECSNGSYYTGYTKEIEKRYREHVQGSPKCKYTRSFPPIRLAACWEFDCELSYILKLERFVKTLTKMNKMRLIAEPDQLYLQAAHV